MLRSVQQGVEKHTFLRCGKHRESYFLGAICGASRNVICSFWSLFFSKVCKDMFKKWIFEFGPPGKDPYFRAKGGVEITKTYEN